MTEDEKVIVDLRIQSARTEEILKGNDKALILAANTVRSNMALVISLVALALTIWKLMKGAP